MSSPKSSGTLLGRLPRNRALGISGNEMDYQPLALAIAGVFVRKLRNTNPAFDWEGYLEKLGKRKRELTEKEFAKVYSIYPNFMTTATRVAV